MKTMNRFFCLLILAAVCFVFLNGCDNLAGLGSRINTERPDIIIPDDVIQPGAFLSGTDNVVEVLVEHEFEVVDVYMTISFIPEGGTEAERTTKTLPWVDRDGDRWSFNIDATGMADGDIRVQVTAIDEDGFVTRTIDLIYVVLNTPPQLVITLPEGLTEYVDNDSQGVTGTVSFIGTVSARVVRMYYALGVEEVNNPDLGATSDDNTGWTNTRLNCPDGQLPLAGHIRLGQTLHDLGPMQVNWGGDLTTSWMWRFQNIADIVDPYYVDALNENAAPDDFDYNLWVLPIKFRLVDQAGNVTTVKVEVLVDPDADLPVTTITSHYNEQIVGGPIRISGTAEDNEVIHAVYMRLYRESDADALSNTVTAPEDFVQVHDWINIADGDGNAFISWTALINNDLSLHPPAGAERRLVRAEFRSRDAFAATPTVPKDFGRIVSVILQFDNTAPIIDTPEFLFGRPSEIGAAAIEDFPGEQFNFVDGSLLSGFVTMRVVVRAHSGLQSIRVRSGNVNVELLGNVSTTLNDTTPWLSERRIPSGGEVNSDEYTLFIPLNTNILSGAAGASQFGSGFLNSAALFSLEISLEDGTDPTPFMARNTYTMRMDNRFPLGNYTGLPNVINPSYDIRGDAWDHGSGVSVHGVDRVVVFFSRPGVSAYGEFGIPLTLTGNASSSGSAGWVTDQDAMVNHRGTLTAITQQGTLQTLPFFPNDFSSTGTGIEITAMTTSGGFSGSLGGPPLHNWHITNFSLAAFDDGELYVNYVIFDHAGNATHYRERIFLAINRPIIRSIDLGTNLGAGTVFSTRSVLHEPVDANFRVRGNTFSMRFDMINPEGDPITSGLDYDVAHVTRRSGGAIPASQMVQGGVYRIADGGTDSGPNAVSWLNYGVFVDLNALGPGGVIVDPVGITFVATRDGTAANDGMVYAYDIPPVGDRRRQGSWTSATVVTFDGASFAGPNAARPIPDSAKVLQSDGVNFYLQNDRYFIVRLTDSIGITNTALVRVDVHNDDTTPPVINIADFGRRSEGAINGTTINNFAQRHIVDLLETEYNMNIVMSPSGVRRGYVQYHWHSDTPRADISGRVIFRGNIADNDRVQRIDVSIDGAAPVTVAQWSGTQLVSTVASVTSMGNDNSTAIWGFDVSYQVNTQDYGHVLNWEFAWDSARFAGVVRNNIPITFTVTDHAGLSASQTINVNVVPFIAEVVTSLSAVNAANPSAFNRSAMGWYPVRENEEITIRGFNLGGTGSATSVTLNGQTLDIVGGVSSDQVRVDIGEIAESGSLVVTVTPTAPAGSAITSINNRNNDEAHYNREPNNLNNNILTNARYLYVWQTGFLLNANLVTNPIMRMRYNSTWFLNYGRWGSGGIGHGPDVVIVPGLNASQLRIVRSLGTGAVADLSDTQIQSFANRYLNMGMAIDGAGDWFVAASNMSVAGDIMFNFAVFSRIATNNITSWVQNGIAHRNLLRLTGNINRVRTPSLFAQTPGGGSIPGSDAAATRVLMGYFDSFGNNNALFFRYGLVGGPTTATAGFGGNFPNSTTYNPTSHLFLPVQGGAGPGLPANSPQVIANDNTTHQGSSHVSVGALSNGLPVVAWFDRVNQNLVFSHGGSSAQPPLNNTALATSVTGTGNIVNATTQQWQDNAVIIHHGVGTHVAMAIGSDNVIHLAYYDVVNGGLFYARVYPTGSGLTVQPDMNNIHVARVDTFLSAGTNLSINVREETHGTATFYVPYISYFHASFRDTRNSIRVAWLRPDSAGNMTVRHGTFGGNLSLGPGIHQGLGGLVAAGFPADTFTGAWEVMTVPARNTPVVDEFVGIGVPRTGRFFAPIDSGGEASNLARAGSFAASAAGLHRSVLVGYMTDAYYEGAVLKFSIGQ